MKKLKAMLVLTGATVALMSFTAYAGQWQQDVNGKWWQNDDGSYPAGKWEWIDDNGDGVSESYYFNESGYALTNTATPDGYMVNENGAWVVDGVVQTQNTSNNKPSETEAQTEPAPAPYTPAVVTTGMQNALKKAHSYLEFSSFSHDRLIDQLEYEKFSHEEALYGADNCGANWYEQAYKKAQSYLEFSAFSYSGLIKQLEYEKFTKDQARYGVDNCGADWNEQAAKKAKSYLDFSSFSRDGLIRQLEFEGFTHDQAVYGVSQNGY